MIEEKDYGYRDQKGHFVPNEAAEKNPLWVLLWWCCGARKFRLFVNKCRLFG